MARRPRARPNPGTGRPRAEPAPRRERRLVCQFRRDRARFQQPPARETREEALNRQRAGVRSFGKLLKFMEAREVDKAEAHWRAHMQNANLAWLAG